MITTLRIKKNYGSANELAIRWFSIISILNDFKWTPLDIKLLAFICIKGDIYGNKRRVFQEQTKCAKNSLANSLTKLKKKGFLYKENKKIRVHPQLFIDFNTDILTTLNLIHD